MFLRNIARSLSFGSFTHRGSRDGKDQQSQQTQSPSTKHQTPIQVHVECSEVGARKPGLGSNGNLAPAAPLPRACLQTQQAPKPVADDVLNSLTSAPASTIINIDNRSNVVVDQSRQVLSTTPTLRPISRSSCTASVVSKDGHRLTSTLDSADQNPASNFPFRPLQLQTLSADTDHDHLIATPKEPQLPSIDTRRLPSHPASTGNELETAMQRKVWVKRPGASATRVEVSEDDLVDNVRDVILRKYANSLGRHIDSPDITLKIVSREQANKTVPSERVLGPEEGIGRTLDTYYPGGQTIEEALIIEVPQKRTPKPSPRPGNHMSYYVGEDYRPGVGASEYFPPMPLHSPHLAHVQHPAGLNGSIPVHSMSVLTTGQVPPLPSPGGQHPRTRHQRPRNPRNHTSSPTIIHGSQPNGTDGKPQINGIAAPTPSLPTPPAAVGDKSAMIPPNRTTSPHPSKAKKKRQAATSRDMNSDPPMLTKPASASLLDGRVPPINVLLVEDNVINLKLLEQFMKRLKVRWKSAMNGKEAVNMWRQGGFHLVLMDIQLPVMNGLEATKEIRRLESVNGIGLSVFGETTVNGETNGNTQLSDEDRLEDRNLFKSPVIIVALTASSLQSDRHEALAVGCNDFLTKPVNFVWMERKVTEWGCMQALIDFDGWRRWKAIAEKKANEDPEKRKQEEKEERQKAKAALQAMFSRQPPSTRRDGSSESAAKEDTASRTPNGTGNSNATDQTPNRRAHKGSKSQSGSFANSLGVTPEEEKEG